MSYPSSRAVQASLVSLIVLQAIMLSSLYAGIPPHPPEAIPLFGMAPFLAMAFCAAGAALVMGPLDSRAGRVLSLVAAAAAAVSFGPQKYFDAQFALIYPAVITGQISILVIFAACLRGAVPSETRALA